MPRERREFKRESFVREVQRLFVIATEGKKTEIKYFEEFSSKDYYNNKEVYIEVLKRVKSGSSPTNVVKQLNGFKSEYKLKNGDELWMIIDRDKQSWKPKEIASVARLCLQKKYGFALSNPSFEVWLLLHRKDLKTYTDAARTELLINKKTNSRTRLESELLNICGSYNKTNLKVADYLPHVKKAIKRSESLVQSQTERWPNYLGSHVFKLVKKLLP